jgi:DNA-binding HxlR family transcriptional regulator
MALLDKRIRGSRSKRPVMILLDLLGRRWTLRLMWELRDGEAVSSRTLRERCDGMSPSVLNTRIAELREARLVDAGEHGYVLTARGRELLALLLPLNAWADRWGADAGGRR